MEVKNKTCIVTGSAQGLGKTFAKIMLDHGAKVCISDVNEDAVKATSDEFKGIYGDEMVCFVKCDVTKEDEFLNLFDETEKFFMVDCIDLLVNNAGVNTNFGWKKCMDVNIIGLMIGCDIAMKKMTKSPTKGSIINIASLAGIVTGMGEEALGYSVSKHGVVALTRTLAVDYTHHGISIKALCPAWADTEIVSSAKELSPKVNKSVTQSIRESGGIMTPEYVADGFYKLLSDCGNGTVMGAMKDTPFFVIPDTGKIKVLVLVAVAKLIKKLNGNDLITVMHQKLFLALFMLALFFIFSWVL